LKVLDLISAPKQQEKFVTFDTKTHH